MLKASRIHARVGAVPDLSRVAQRSVDMPRQRNDLGIPVENPPPSGIAKCRRIAGRVRPRKMVAEKHPAAGIVRARLGDHPLVPLEIKRLRDNQKRIAPVLDAIPRIVLDLQKTLDMGERIPFCLPGLLGIAQRIVVGIDEDFSWSP